MSKMSQKHWRCITTIYNVVPNLVMNEQNIWKKSSAMQMGRAMTNVNTRKLCLFVKFILSKF